MIYPDCDMKRWSHCDNSVVLANADYYYTKEQVDKKFDDFDGVTDEEVQRMINTSIRTKADKADVNALSGQVQANTDAIDNTYTKQETNAAVTAATTPINNTLTAHTADTAIHVTSAEKTYWNNKLDASAYTPTDLSNYYTKGQTDDLLDDKLDVTAYTPTDLSNYYTKQETNGVVNGAVSGKADTTYVNQIAAQATEAITALTQTVSNNYTEHETEIESLYANKFGYASYDSQTQRINFYSRQDSSDVLTYIDATAFIKDGMVSNVEIINGNLVITFNSDAGKQPISIPLTDIFNPANYYTTAQTQSYVSGFTYDKATIDQKVAEGGTFDPDLYYDKTATNALLAAKADKTECLGDVKIDTAWSNGSRLMTYKADGSGEQTRGYFSKINGNYIATNYSFNTMDFQLVEKSAITSAITSSSTNSEVAGAKAVYDAIDAATSGKADTSAVTAVNDALTAHTADTTVHVTSAEKTTWNNKSDFSGDYNDLTNKPTIPTVPTNVSDFTNDAGYITNADITGKADTSAVTQVNDALTAHTANTSVHVTAAEKAEWDDKAEVIELTQAQYDALVTKDPDVLYVISDAAPAEVIITTTITSSSTNGQVPSAKAVYDQMGGLKLVSLTQAQYDALSTKDASTIYFING